MRLKEAAEFLRISDDKLAEILVEQKIRRRKIGKIYLFGKKALENWLDFVAND